MKFDLASLRSSAFLFGLICGVSSSLAGQSITLPSAANVQTAQSPPGSRTLVDAHNCYPYQGRWDDRIVRALASGMPLAIEEDVALYTDPQTGVSTVVVSHAAKTTGKEPSLRQYFFERLRPRIETALKERDQTKWPLVTLNLEFKSEAPELLQAVWSLLGEYRPWLTTAARGRDLTSVQPLHVRPLLVLTGESDVLQSFFFDRVPVGDDLRLFGAAHMNRSNLMAAPEVLVARHANDYRRWWNNPWSVVEAGGPRNAGDWTQADANRLTALVQHAHHYGYWIRFYTLDGDTDPSLKENGWFADYNFGSLSAVQVRWKAAQMAGVDSIASDQYEQLGRLLRSGLRSPAPRSGLSGLRAGFARFSLPEGIR